MRLSIFALLALAATCIAAEPRPSEYMNGQVVRELDAGFQKAREIGKPVVLITFDAKNKKMTTPYTLGGFFQMPETRKLLAANFVQVFTPWSSKGVEQYLDPTDKTELPEAIFIDKDGKLITRVRFQYGPAQALEHVQAVVAMIQGQPAQAQPK